MKKLIALTLCALMLLTLAACGSKADGGRDAEQTEADAGGERIMVGGWTAAESNTVTDEQSELLAKAVEGLVGAEYFPLAYLGSQLVAGSNHCFLCEITPVVPEPVPVYSLVYVYEALDGSVRLMNTADISVSELIGGEWSSTGDGDITYDVEEMFDKATEGLLGADYVPLAYIAYSEGGYCLFCRSTVVYPDAQPGYCLFEVTAEGDNISAGKIVEINISEFCEY